jgi:hypothetical protein
VTSDDDFMLAPLKTLPATVVTKLSLVLESTAYSVYPIIVKVLTVQAPTFLTLIGFFIFPKVKNRGVFPLKGYWLVKGNANVRRLVLVLSWQLMN